MREEILSMDWKQKPIGMSFPQGSVPQKKFHRLDGMEGNDMLDPNDHNNLNPENDTSGQDAGWKDAGSGGTENVQPSAQNDTSSSYQGGSYGANYPYHSSYDPSAQQAHQQTQQPYGQPSSYQQTSQSPYGQSYQQTPFQQTGQQPQQPYGQPYQQTQQPYGQSYQAPQYQAPQYQAEPYYAQPVQKKSSGMAVGSLVCGILSVVLCCVIWVSWIEAIVAIVLGIISLSSDREGKGMAIAGIVTGAFGLLLFIGFLVLWMTTGSLELMDSVYSYGSLLL
ncbi:MAG: DUF4190 domain-containing protein [Hydrogeniiclostridium sp.]